MNVSFNRDGQRQTAEVKQSGKPFRVDHLLLCPFEGGLAVWEDFYKAWDVLAFDNLELAKSLKAEHYYNPQRAKTS